MYHTFEYAKYYRDNLKDNSFLINSLKVKMKELSEKKCLKIYSSDIKEFDNFTEEYVIKALDEYNDQNDLGILYKSAFFSNI